MAFVQQDLLIKVFCFSGQVEKKKNMSGQVEKKKKYEFQNEHELTSWKVVCIHPNTYIFQTGMGTEGFVIQSRKNL